MTNSEKNAATWHTPVRLRDLKGAKELAVDVRPEAPVREALAKQLGILAVRKLSLSGKLRSVGKGDWAFSGVLGATVVQECVATLQPVTTRIEEPVKRLFVTELPDPGPGSETEIPEDVDVEQLSDPIDLGFIMAEALALALPPFPRAEGAGAKDFAVSEPGTEPMTDEDAKPFASLAELRKKLADKDG